MEQGEPRETLTPRTVRRGQEDPDGEPSSPYVHRKLRADSSPKEVAYQLRTRSVYKQGQEVLRRDEQNDVIPSQENQETALLNTEHLECNTHTTVQSTDPYNLRKRL